MRRSLCRRSGSWTARGRAADGVWLIGGGFAAGLLGALVFDQGTLLLLHSLGRSFPVLLPVLGPGCSPGGAVPVAALGLEQAAAAAVAGGLGGIALTAVLRRWRPATELLAGALFGAVAVTLADSAASVALERLRGSAGGEGHTWLCAGLANGAWGWGTALLLKLTGQSRPD